MCSYLHHVSELFLGDFSIWMPLQKVGVPLIDLFPRQSSVPGNVVQVFVVEDLGLAITDIAHFA